MTSIFFGTQMPPKRILMQVKGISTNREHLVDGKCVI
jgi:hypothetical protein